MAEENCVPVQLEGKAGTTAEGIDGLKSGNYVSFQIDNTHSSNTLYLSMSGKQHWKKIAAGGTVTLRGTAKHPIQIKEEDWYLKGSGSDTTYEIIMLRIT